MPAFFPRHTIEWRLEEPRAFRRLSRSLIQMAMATGIVLRVYRLLILTHGSNNWLYLGGTLGLGLIFLIGMLTAHLANYPLRQYAWRAPYFALIEVASEMAVSALLIVAGYEPNGTVRAHWDDWFGLGLNALLVRGLAILFWSAILAAVVQLVRRTLVRDDEDLSERPAT